MEAEDDERRRKKTKMMILKLKIDGNDKMGMEMTKLVTSISTSELSLGPS